MGNSSSSQAVHRRSEEQQGWANSYPRDPRGARGVKAPQNKVLPERIPGQRLRVTDNGAILQNGGTISGRRQTISLGEQYSKHDKSPPGAGGRVYRSRSTSTHQHPRQPQPTVNGGGSEGMGKRFGSEPDLRFPHTNHTDSPAKQRISRSRKKYKAPAPPPESQGQDSSSPDSCRWDTLDPPARRARLFKTRAETKKNASNANKRLQEQEVAQPPTLQRSLSSPEFQAELLQAARRLRSGPPAGALREGPVGEAAVRGEGSGRESTTTPEPPPPRRTVNPAPQLPPRKKPESRKTPGAHWEIIPPAGGPVQERRHGGRDVPVKTFYFGMEQGEREAVDRFAASLRVPASLSSDEPEDEVESGRGGIALQLRPTLPKKQLEIPRFSPTAAWRLLSQLDAHAPSTSPALTDDGSVLLEERIQRLARPVAPPPPQQVLQQQAPRSSHDKSGDSGISGDASPGGMHEDSSEAPAPLCRKPAPPAGPTRPLVVAWTPQQDLEEEESSSDGGVDVPAPTGTGVVQPKFSPRSHVFSLSLPRDDRLCLSLYADNVDVIAPKLQDRREVPPSFNSLKKLRRSVSGVLGAALGGGSPTKGEPLDENWLLSRSVPNSLHLETTWGTRHPSTSSPSSPDHDVRPSFSYLQSGGHVMYLPEYQSRRRTSPEELTAFGRDRSYSTGVAARNLRSAVPLSKSCDNISAVSEMRQLGRTPSPECRPEVEVPTTTPTPPPDKDAAGGKRSKGRRFTFQSTVRQIERRRLAEKLSREAELKERQRLGELEAMRRVEEEFQRKRAREKANIRQQLRLFSLDEQLYSSLPAGWGDARADPDGAPSSTPSPASGASSGPPKTPRQPVSTQVLSEFRQPSRDYREYRQSRYLDSGPESLLSHAESKRATVHHPQVVYDMPKSTQVYVAPRQQGENEASTPRSSSSDNYRRDFAHGTRPGRSLASSDSELSQPATRPVSRHQHRSRSASPASGCRSAYSSLEEVCRIEEKKTSAYEDDVTNSPHLAEASASRFSLTTVQPFVRNSKGYRPIVFNPGTPTSHNVAQTVS
ncbi:uncharacterized protein [Periplaneta americana]|uniref:uncharacterized protein isoform X1 n=1 Tax=Periplaneta americana TaxID=6978 RepID=UPI0037E8FB51